MYVVYDLDLKSTFILSKMNNVPQTFFCESGLTKRLCSTETDLDSLGREGDVFAFGLDSLPWFALYICTVIMSLVTTP